MILVTGGAGFIGTNFIIDWFVDSEESVLNIDNLTYAGNLSNLQLLSHDPRHIFVKGDIANRNLIDTCLEQYKPRAIIHFAAESHVDRSIQGPEAFIQTNILGTFTLLEAARHYWNKLPSSDMRKFKFLHVSTDEVYGSLGVDDDPFTEMTQIKPNSPYSASKASSDHLVRAWYHTYGLPVMTTNCSNNYGPYQFPEKLIPLMIVNALQGKSLPIYGDGLQVRDWLYVKDHCSAIRCVLQDGSDGEVYNVGGWNEKTNIEIVHTICKLLDLLKPKTDGSSYQNQIKFVPDRLGHDRRYAINAQKINQMLSWKPKENFDSGIRKTIKWYLDNHEWIQLISNRQHNDAIKNTYHIKQK